MFVVHAADKINIDACPTYWQVAIKVSESLYISIPEKQNFRYVIFSLRIIPDSSIIRFKIIFTQPRILFLTRLKIDISKKLTINVKGL